ncbi:hypothetical protein GC088_02535 [Arthrobacter sp. JZ12]|uniref:hypothetical protein n=1 Tax=Arthrobacter sp. JZ12 TaxID=2654190 RepID=UPI002B45B09D|nr:hypothetical protein [Arthrobacter sp. JZ12]WRH24087.1 hypothetical protein GC088_02535 [Arthrobacter sp. JZ12]
MTQNDSPRHEDLPLPDYDHLPLGTLPTRITGLDESGVAALLDYERAHGDRLPVVQILENRLEALRNGAEPSGTAVPDTPEKSSAAGGSPVTPATSGPPVNPPSQGDPTNPAQPR